MEVPRSCSAAAQSIPITACNDRQVIFNEYLASFDKWLNPFEYPILSLGQKFYYLEQIFP